MCLYHEKLATWIKCHSGIFEAVFLFRSCNDTVLCYRHIEFCDILQTVALLETCIDSLLPLMYGIYKLLGSACLWDVLRHKTLKHSQLSSVALYHQNTINSIFTMAPSYTLGSFNWYKFRHKRLCIAYGRLNSVLQDCSFAQITNKNFSENQRRVLYFCLDIIHLMHDALYSK